MNLAANQKFFDAFSSYRRPCFLQQVRSGNSFGLKFVVETGRPTFFIRHYRGQCGWRRILRGGGSHWTERYLCAQDMLGTLAVAEASGVASFHCCFIHVHCMHHALSYGYEGPNVDGCDFHRSRQLLKTICLGAGANA